ncbi:MAG: ATP-binding protein [Verrucomicrobiales bacterium]|nr:ATP-binding protein [Verrucomicrobiales bacterium]
MIQKLTLTNFKSFVALAPRAKPPNRIVTPLTEPEGVTVQFGGLTLIIGTNASGKSNLRDALRFLHGVARGYSLVEILGERAGPSGEPQWEGIRGGVLEAVARDSSPPGNRFALAVETRVVAGGQAAVATYRIEVEVGERTRIPQLAYESLSLSSEKYPTFHTEERTGSEQIRVRYRKRPSKGRLGPSERIRSDQPAVTQLAEHPGCPAAVTSECRAFLESLAHLLFLNLEPTTLRKPSFRGQRSLGERGENLSSVLEAICSDPMSKAALLEWLSELAPLDVTDLDFPEVDQVGRIQLRLLEHGGRALSAESASDGTLRFLGYAAAVLGTGPARCYFIEELENGVHPNRAYLLLELLRLRTRAEGLQVIATTHSPALLDFLTDEDLAHAVLIYRVGNHSRAQRLAELQWLEEVRKHASAGQLHSSGWFENVAAILASEESP